MLRNISVAVAIVLVLESTALSTSAFARSDSSGGGRAAAFRGDYIADGIGRGRIADRGCAAYAGHTHNLCGRLRAYAPPDVWGQWGTYYGPMVHAP